MSTKADKAVAAILTRIQHDPRLAYYFDPFTQFFELLTDAFAEANGLDVNQFRQKLAAKLRYEPPQCPDCKA